MWVINQSIMDFVSTLRGVLDDVRVTHFPSWCAICASEEGIYKTRGRGPKTQDQKGHHCLLIMFSNAPFVLRSKAPLGSTQPWPHLGLRLSPRVMLRSTFKGNFDLVRWVRGCLVSENPHRQEFLLSPSGDLGIGLVWDNRTPDQAPPTFWSHWILFKLN